MPEFLRVIRLSSRQNRGEQRRARRSRGPGVGHPTQPHLATTTQGRNALTVSTRPRPAARNTRACLAGTCRASSSSHPSTRISTGRRVASDRRARMRGRSHPTRGGESRRTREPSSDTCRGRSGAWRASCRITRSAPCQSPTTDASSASFQSATSSRGSSPPTATRKRQRSAT